jgi:hypothetical protein
VDSVASTEVPIRQAVRSPNGNEIFIMVMGDYGQFHVVDVTGFQSRGAAYIKELIFSTVRGTCPATSPFSEIYSFLSFEFCM